MMSVNQMAIYHTIMEVFNIVYNSSSEQIHNKFIHQDRRSLRKNANNFVKVPETPKIKNVLASLTVVQKFSTASQTTSEKLKIKTLSNL